MRRSMLFYSKIFIWLAATGLSLCGLPHAFAQDSKKHRHINSTSSPPAPITRAEPAHINRPTRGKGICWNTRRGSAISFFGDLMALSPAL